LKPLNVGIVGAGQLGRMMALAGYPLGIRCSFLDKSVDAPAAQVAPILTGGLEDPVLLEELAAKSDVLTFDWENISGKALAPLESLTKVRPPRAALEISQDRLHEKALFKRLKIPVAEHAAVDSRQDLAEAAEKLGIPGVLKTRRMGYDGKGQFVIGRSEHIDAAWAAIGAPGLIYEKFQSFSMELSIVAARSPAGDIVYYPNPSIWDRALCEPRTRAYGENLHEARPLRARVHGRARDRILRGQGPADRQRNGATSSQFRPLDHRGLHHQPIREPPPRDLRLASRQHAAAGTHRHDQFPGRNA
jgi:hypothetical protein